MELGQEEQRKKIEKFIKRMPSLSTTVGKVLEICSRVDASPNELNKVISLDPVLTGQVLKLINSAYYSLLNRVTSLTRAITMLGMNTVKNMALSTAVIQSVGSVKRSRALPTTKFWAHSIGVGVCAKLLAASMDVPIGDREEFFVAGLLHDLGKVPFGDEYIDVLQKAQDTQRPLVEIELDEMGLTHQEVGKIIAAKWKLNDVVTECISCHHDVSQASEENRVQVACVALANMYINILDIGYAGNPFPDDGQADELLAITGLDWDDISKVSDSVQEEIRKAQVFLQV